LQRTFELFLKIARHDTLILGQWIAQGKYSSFAAFHQRPSSSTLAKMSRNHPREMKNDDSNEKPDADFQKLFPDLNGEKLWEAQANFDRYLDFMLGVYERIPNDPQAYTKTPLPCIVTDESYNLRSNTIRKPTLTRQQDTWVPFHLFLPSSPVALFPRPFLTSFLSSSPEDRTASLITS
jgi:hypothetical protein